MIDLYQNIPQELRDLPRWVLWKLVPKDGRMTKIPFQESGCPASSTNPGHWLSFEAAQAALASGRFTGLGFVFNGDGITGIDLDKHRNPDTGSLDEFARAIVDDLSSYTEVSPSGTGLHVIVRATIPGESGRRDAKQGLEAYSSGRFFCMTGQHLSGTPLAVEHRQAEVERFYAKHFAPKPEQPTLTIQAPAPVALAGDEDLLRRAAGASNGSKFSMLWRGDWAGSYGSQSEADAALLGLLYFWCQGDQGRAFSLFARSGLNREKWAAREDYRLDTWQKVAHGPTYDPAHRSPAPTAAPAPVDDAGDTDPVVERFGPSVHLNEKGFVSGLNERYWAGLYATENRVLHDPDEQSFYLYNEARGLWQIVSQDSIREAISTRILERSRDERQPSLGKQITTAKLKGIVAALAGIVEKRGAFAEKRRIIHVKNGVVRFTPGGDVLFGGFDPDDFSRNQSPHEFDETAECPRFLAELIDPAVSADDADLIQRWAGLALYGYNLPQRFLILDGVPGGGKGVLVRIIQSLVGIENSYQLRTDLLNERFELYRYRGKTLLFGPDVPGDFLQQKGASRLKVIVGGDPLSVEAKGSNGDFQMFGVFNVVMSCNSRLQVRLDGDVGAWRRRMLIVRYSNPPVAKRILDFDKALLREEGPGILRWALQGFVKLQAEFDELGDFRLTDAQRGRVESLLAESDSLPIFIRERLVKTTGGSITTGELMQRYSEFCADRKWNSLPSGVVESRSEDLMLQAWQVSKSHSIERDGRKSNRGWRGVAFKEEFNAL